MTTLLRPKKTSGLTLVEILIVVALIAVISVIAIPNFMRSHTTAKESTVDEALRQVFEKMEQIFWGQNPNEYPPTSAMPEGLVAWATPTNLGNVDDLVRLFRDVCEKKDNMRFPDSVTSNQTALLTAIKQCMDDDELPFSYTSDGQDYLFSLADGNGGYKTVSNGGLGYTTTPPPVTCPNGYQDDGEGNCVLTCGSHQVDDGGGNCVCDESQGYFDYGEGTCTFACGSHSYWNSGTFSCACNSGYHNDGHGNCVSDAGGSCGAGYSWDPFGRQCQLQGSNSGNQ